MKSWILAVVMVILLAPSLVSAQAHRGECRKITRQIAHFNDVAGTARSRGDGRWLGATNDHIRRLSMRRSRLCPGSYSPPPEYQWMADFQRVAKVAGQAALRYFTFGWY